MSLFLKLPNKMSCADSENFCCCLGLALGTKIINVVNILATSIFCVVFLKPLVENPHLPPARLIFYWCMFVFLFLQLLTGCLMLYATTRKKPKLVQPWVVVSTLLGVTLAVTCVLGIFCTFFDNEATNEEAIVIAFYFFAAVLILYFVHVVRSYQMQMIREEEYHEARNQYYS